MLSIWSEIRSVIDARKISHNLFFDSLGRPMSIGCTARIIPPKDVEVHRLTSRIIESKHCSHFGLNRLPFRFFFEIGVCFKFTYKPFVWFLNFV
jgi:hypothetical protein